MIPSLSAHPTWKQDALDVVSKDGMKLKPVWANDIDIVKAAIRNDPLAIRLAEPFQNNYQVAKLAVSINGLAYLYLSENLKKEKELIRLSRKMLPRLYQGPDYEYPKQRCVYYISKICCDPLKIIDTFTDIFDVLIPVALKHEECSMFIRDSKVTLVDGSNLIPHLIYEEQYRQLLYALLPSTAQHLLIDPITKGVEEVSLGKGFHFKNVIQAELHSYEYRIPFTMGKTCIEGGNAFSFRYKSRPFLILGEMSLYLSLISMDNAGFFKNKSINCDEEPNDDAYRAVKNIERYFALRRPLEKNKPDKICDDKDLARFGGELGYRTLLFQSVSEKEKPFYKEQAKKMMGFIRLAKERIAKETKTPIDNIIFFPQKYFHIDLDTFVTPSGEVVLHDDGHAITLLNHLLNRQSLTPDERALFEDYLKTAIENGIRFKNAMAARIEALQKMNIPFHLIPASFVSEKYSSHLNYCNGVFLRQAKVVQIPIARIRQPTDNFIYLTTGPTFKEELLVHERIKKLFENLFPRFIFREIPNLSEFISQMHGGFRCLSFESIPASEI